MNNGIYNPYSQFNNSINQTNYIGSTVQSTNGSSPAPVTQMYIPSNNIGPQISSNGNPIILANTHLPRSYYDDIIDNLELVSLNMINDLKVLIKNQKNVKVSQFDTTEFINLKDAVREQFMEMKDYKDSHKNKLIDEFSKTKKSIKKFLEEKFQPGQALLGKFAEDLKRDKQKFNDNINSCEDSLNEESDNIRKLLLSSTDWYVKVASQKVYQPHDPSDLENALKLKKLYGTDEEKQEVEDALEEAKKSPVNIMIDNNPDEIDEILRRQKELDDIIKKDKERLGIVDEELENPQKEEVDEYEQREFSDNCQSEKERTDSDEDELRDKTKEELEKELMEQLKEANLILERKKRQRKFKVLALAIFASQKLQVIKEEKKITRIKEFNQTLLSVDEYLAKLMDEFLFKPKENIAQCKMKIDLTLANNVEKLEEYMKNIIDT